MKKIIQSRAFLLIFTLSILPVILNQFGLYFGSTSTNLNVYSTNVVDISKDQQFYALSGALHHALLEWTAVGIALMIGFISFFHYYRYRDISVPIIGMALFCAGFTDAFHTLAATRIISANVPNTDFIPFTWVFSRIFNAFLMIVGISISLWVTRDLVVKPDHQQKVNKKYGMKLLVSICIAFIALAIVSVILAATSQELPKTTFPYALITRPYDVFPLALFMLSGILIWIGYQRLASTVKLALLLSLIPEIAAQLHMSFGSTGLFDNHFNIAHTLKIFAYACVLFGMVISIIQVKSVNQSQEFSSEDHAHRNLFARFSTSSQKIIKQKELEVGRAKYPYILIISSFSFLLTITVTLMVSSLFYIDTERLVRKQKFDEMVVQANLIEPLIKSAYADPESNLIFLGELDVIQEFVEVITERENKKKDQLQIKIETIFVELVRNKLDYQSIEIIQFDKTVKQQNRTIIKTYKMGQNVYSMKSASQDMAKNSDLKNHISSMRGRVTSYILAEKNSSRSDTKLILNVALPIYDKRDGVLFGAINLKLNLMQYFKKLELDKLIKNSIYLTDKEGVIIYSIDSTYTQMDKTRSGHHIKSLFPILEAAIKNQVYELVLDKYNDVNRVDETAKNITGYYRTIYLQASDGGNVIGLVVVLNSDNLTNELNLFKNRSLVLGFSLSIIGLFLAILVSRKISLPLQKTIQELTRYYYTGKIGKLPIEATDEAGVMARSFHNLLVSKALQDKELLQHKAVIDEHAIVSITNIKGDIIYANDKFSEISGYEHAELLGKNHRIVNSGYHGFKFFRDMYKEISKGKIWHGEICNKSKNGDIYWVQTTIFPFMNEQQKTPESYMAIRTDITDNKNNVKKLAHTRDELSYKVLKLQEANAELDQFAYVASHDLKSPLNGISQLVSWIEEDCADILPVDSKEHLDLLRSRSKRMINLLNDLLDYSRVGRQQYEIKSFYLAALVDDIFDLLGDRDGFSCHSANVQLSLQKVPFELVIRNLISNSLKHHDKKTGMIEVSCEKDEKYYYVRVQDDGPGIPQKLQNKAMEMFQTLQSRDKIEGSGMGLALVKKTVEHHGGSVEIDSKNKRGMGIIIKWPILEKDNSKTDET